MIDTHSHIYAEEFDADRHEALARAREAGIEMLLLPAIDSESHSRMFELALERSDYCRPMMGLHPTSINRNPAWREELSMVESYLDNPPLGLTFCAVGEIGLDYYWSDEYKQQQREAFVAQCRMAARRDMPVVIHTRSAWEDMYEILAAESRAAAERGERLRGVLHAYSEGVEMYERLRECGDFLFGVGGVVTFKKSQLAVTVEQMRLEDILLETDCPYLTPAPHRGERNESAYVEHICRKVAEIKSLPMEQVAMQTSANARRLFSL